MTDDVHVKFGATIDGFIHGVEGIKDRIEGLLSPIAKLQEAFAAVGEVVAAAFAVEKIVEFTRAMGEAAEKIEHIATAFGMTNGQVQQLQGLANAAGTTLDTLTGATTRLDRALGQANAGGKRQQEVFARLGIDTNVARTQYDLLQTSIAALARQPPGIDKVQEAVTLFGRSLQQIAPIIGISAEQLAAYNAQAERYGVVNEAAVEKGAALGAQLNESKNAGQGFMNVLTEALAPALTEIVKLFNSWVGSMIDSYRQGGAVKDILDTLSTLITVVGVIFDQVGQTVVALFNAMTGSSLSFHDTLSLLRYSLAAVGILFVEVATTIRVALEGMTGGAQIFGTSLTAVGRVLQDVFTLNWGAIANDWQRGLDDIAARVAETTLKIANDVANSQHQLAMLAIAAMGIHWGPNAAPEAAPGKSKGDALGHGHAKKSGGPSATEKMSIELAADENAMRQSTGAWLADMKSFELQFWTDRLAQATAGSKAYIEIEKKVEQLTLEANRSREQEQLTADKDAIAAARENWAAALTGWAKYLGDVSQFYGADSREYAHALAEQRKAVEAHNREVIADAIKANQAQETEERASLQVMQQMRQTDMSDARAVLDAKVAAGAIGERQAHQLRLQMLQEELQASQEFARQDYQIQATHLQDQLALLREHGQQETAQYRQLDTQLSALENQFHNQSLTQERQYLSQVLQENIKAADQVRQKWSSAIGQVVQSWGSAVKGLITYTTSWHDALLQVGNTILDVVVQAIETWLTSKLTALITGQAAEKTAAAASIATNVSLAGSGGVASMAAAPFPLDLGAPEFGAAMAAAAGAFGIAASAAGGWDEVPAAGAVTRLHPKEMVLSAQFADPLRTLLKGGYGLGATGQALRPSFAASNDNAASGGGGDHFHFTPNISAWDSRDVKRWLSGTGGKLMMDEFAARVRNNWRPKGMATG